MSFEPENRFFSRSKSRSDLLLFGNVVILHHLELVCIKVEELDHTNDIGTNILDSDIVAVIVKS